MPRPAGATDGLAPPPQPSVRVRTETLDRLLSTVGEVILHSSQVRTSAHAEGRPRSGELASTLDRMDRVVGDLQRRALELRTTPLLRILEPLPRAAREIAAKLGKKVEVVLRGAELELDRSILDRLGDPLVHLLRNAVDHGLEIEARRERDMIQIAVRDDGAGIDLDAVRRRAVEAGLLPHDVAVDLPPEQVAGLIFHAGLSTAAAVSEVSGRGVGMDAVRVTTEALGGTVEVRSVRGRGTTLTLSVPITAAVQRVLLIGVGAETVALPIARVERIVECASDAIERSGREAFVLIDDEPLPVLALAERIAQSACARTGTAVLVLTDVRGARVALEVERIVGQQEIFVKPVPELLAGVRGLAGLTILGDGRPVFVLDPNQLA
jgi:two-component system chemotaxis sensor kinase CheA